MTSLLVVKNNFTDTLSGATQAKTLSQKSHKLLESLLEQSFGCLKGLEASFQVNLEGKYDDEAFDRQTALSLEAQKGLGMHRQVQLVERSVENFKHARQVFTWLAQWKFDIPRTVIPIRSLPELFFLLPVWFIGTGSLQDVINLFPEEDRRDWRTLFSLFNTSNGWGTTEFSLADYQADVLPLDAALRLEKAVELCDFVAITAPANVRNYQRYPDPLIIGLMEGLPCLLLLDHFSDGTVPSPQQLLRATRSVVVEAGWPLTFNKLLPKTLHSLLKGRAVTDRIRS